MDLNWWLNNCYEYICYVINCLCCFVLSIVLVTHAAFQFLMNKWDNGREVTDAHPVRINFLLKMGKKTDDKAEVPKTSGEKSEEGFAQNLKTFGKNFKAGVLKHTVTLKESKIGAGLSDTFAAIKRTAQGIVQMNGDKDSEKYVGLRNQGSTCYLNALLQCLYHTPKFREKLSTNTNKDNETYLAVDSIFHKLDEKSGGATTYKLTASLGLSSCKQQDAPEIFQLLLNALDVGTIEGPCFKEVFWSTMVNLMQCSECHEKDGYQTAVNIIVLPLAVIPTPYRMQPWSVANALEQFQTTKNMTEENEIYCSNCKKKTATSLTQTFTKLPPVLVVQLKRFEYIFRLNSFAKMHDEVLINRTLDVQYEIKTQLKKKSYELFAICDHHGEFWSGHYTAIINPEGRQQWYRFNDYSVHIENENLLATSDRSRTAYLLMYREKSESNVDTSNSSLISQGQLDKEVLKDQKNWRPEDDVDEVSLAQVATMSTSTAPESFGNFDQVSYAQTPQKEYRAGGADNTRETENVFTFKKSQTFDITEEVPNNMTAQSGGCAGKAFNNFQRKTKFTSTPKVSDNTEQVSDDQTLHKQIRTNTQETCTVSTSTTPERAVISDLVSDTQTVPEDDRAGLSPNTGITDTSSFSKSRETSDITEQVHNNQTSQAEDSADKTTDTHERETMPTSKPETSVMSEQVPDAETIQKECRAGGPHNTRETETVFTCKPPEMRDITEQVSDNQTPQKQDSAEGCTNTHEAYTMPTSRTPKASVVSEKFSDTQTAPERESAAILSNTFKIDAMSISKTCETSDITEHVPDTQTTQEEGTAEGAPNTHERETMSTSAPNTPEISEQVPDVHTLQKECRAGVPPNTHETETAFTYKPPHMCDITVQVSDTQTPKKQDSAEGYTNTHETYTIPTSRTPETSAISEKVSDTQTAPEQESATIFSNAFKIDTMAISKTIETSNITEHMPDTQTSQEEGNAEKTPNALERETLLISTLETSDIPEHVSDIQTALKEGSAGRVPSTHEAKTMSTS